MAATREFSMKKSGVRRREDGKELMNDE